MRQQTKDAISLAFLDIDRARDRVQKALDAEDVDARSPKARTNPSRGPQKATRIDIYWDTSDRKNPGWVWSYHAGDDISSGPLADQPVTAGLATLRKRAADAIGKAWPFAARSNDAWETTSNGWRFDA